MLLFYKGQGEGAGAGGQEEAERQGKHFLVQISVRYPWNTADLLLTTSTTRLTINIRLFSVRRLVDTTASVLAPVQIRAAAAAADADATFRRENKRACTKKTTIADMLC